MKHFKLVDNVVGWLTFFIAAFVYCSTIEPTASFWDCPEFITTAYKLEVGHPPGAPFFMLTGNLFTQLTNDPTKVAYMINTMSALMSALCILFLFWSITHLARKLLGKGGTVQTIGQLIAVEASGLVGALAYTFSDTFWFSAVEGEVYAYSSLFTALVFWLILKWEDHADEPHSDRWLVLIAYLTGLSIGVHLLNLLCLPAIVLVFYYRKYPNANLKGSLIALFISFALVAAVLYGIVPGIVKVGGWFELLFVNTFKLPFNTGVIVYLLLLVATVLWAISETHSQHSHKRMIVSYVLSVALLGIPFYGYGWNSVVIGVVVLTALLLALHFFCPEQKRDDKEKRFRTIDRDNSYRSVSTRHYHTPKITYRYSKYNTESKVYSFLITPRMLNTSLLCMLMIMIGYSSYAVIVIRSTANTPMDQNSPEDIFTLGTYLSREQYGDRPLLYGQTYNSEVLLKEDGAYCVPVFTETSPIYQRKEKVDANEPDSYELVRYNRDYTYAQNMFFPRMHSDNPEHKRAYEDWMGGVKGRQVSITNCGRTSTIKMPTMAENLYFFMSYQMNFMYWRYFMWNFAGRQNDIQGNGELEHGNWITGIKWFDNWRLGNQDKLPTELRENKGRNVFYALPLLLGLLGLFWQVYKDGSTTATSKGGKNPAVANVNSGVGVKQFWVVFFLFFMTGLAIVVYLNQTPLQPRERDYAYAGSFYAYAIWIGLGVAAFADLLNRYIKKETLAAVLSCVLILVPIQMASQTWDDHDRSGRYTCRDFGHNYLQSLPEGNHPIIFTNGDNDTFPLWYSQETEGFRTDARVCNLSYLQTDWYIDQMKRPAYDSPSVPISWDRIEYVSGTREAVRIYPDGIKQVMEYYKDDPEAMEAALGENPYELSNIIDRWIRNDNPELQIIPTDSIVVTVDKEAVRKSGMMIAGDSIPDVMHISLKGRGSVYKSELMMLEMLARTNWVRPMYVAVTVGSSSYGDFGKNFVQEGLVNRITPFNTQESGKRIDTEKMYDNMMNKFKFGGIDNPDIYLDETVLRMCYTHRRLFSQLATQLMREGKTEKALKLLQKAEKEIPNASVRYSWHDGSPEMARIWLALGNPQKAEEIADYLGRNACEYLEWYTSLPSRYAKGSSSDLRYYYYELQEVANLMEAANSKKFKQYEEALERFYPAVVAAMER